MKTLIYHHNDEDGWASAATILLKYPDANCVAMNHGDEIFLAKDFDLIFVADYAFGKEEMNFLEEHNKEFIWIDHHKTQIELLPQHFKGVRKDGTAACKLTWQFLFPDKEINPIIETIHRYDVWDLNDNVRRWMFFAQTLLEEKNQPQQIKSWIENYSPEEFKKQLETGKTLLQSQQKQIHKQFLRGSFIDFLGYKAGVYFANSNISELGNYTLEQKPDIDFFVSVMILRNKDKKAFFKYSLRSTPDRVDVAKLAEEFGGGGHPCAAGFESEEFLVNIK
jgi:oligoribonuclease NrnB/cAMP/cGMP phosphodiesterase (DHH superfamily)